VIALNLRPEKAAMPGIYVAPGAIGLTLGVLIGKSGNFSSWHFAAVLTAAAGIILLLRKPNISYSTERSMTYSRFGVILFLILSSIAVRALVGFMLNYPWKANTSLLIIFTLAVVLGKAFGGVMGDRFGWMNVTSGGLLASAFLLPFGGSYPLLAVLGVFLFNLTMPVTLVAVSNMFPGRAGYAFGLTTLALIIGSFPSFTGLRPLLYSNNKLMVIGTVLIMACLLFWGLRLYEKNRLNIFRAKEITDLKDRV
jgi:FSR family fosmidomycin resistance protein-like MFS transporter